MPLYEYRCPDCNARFEKLARHEVADSIPCPDCGGARSRRLISVFATFSAASDGNVGSVSGGCGCGGSCACGGH